MAKERKASSARKPPVPEGSHTNIDQWVRRVMPDLYPIVKYLDDLICETISGLHFAIKWKKAYYGLPKVGWIVEMVAYDVSVNIVFLGGSDINPPPPLGSGDRSRYVKLRTLEEAKQPEIFDWIKKAAHVPGWQ